MGFLKNFVPSTALSKHVGIKVLIVQLAVVSSRLNLRTRVFGNVSSWQV